MLLPYRSKELQLMTKLKRVQEYVESELWAKLPEDIIIKEIKKPVVPSGPKYRFSETYKG